MKNFCRKLCCGLFCCKYGNYSTLKNLDSETRLLPKNEKTKDILEHEELHLFGQVSPKYKNKIINLPLFTQSKVKKIVVSKHVLILFENSKLFGFGLNDEGQLGINITKEGNIEEITEIKFLNENIIKDLKLNEIKHFKILDIAVGDNYSLILIKTDLNKKALIKFGIKSEDKYLNPLESITTVVKIKTS